jgi:hypothetical protein
MAYVWAWPLINLHNRVALFEKLPEPGVIAGAVPAAPPNRASMLYDYVTPTEKMVACPNQDVIYGVGPLLPGVEPAVIQVPDFGDRFWVFQMCDQRTDSFAELGVMYGSKPGHYLVVEDGWDGEVPDGIVEVFRCPTRIGICIPRVFRRDTDAELATARELIDGINIYPLSEYDGTVQPGSWADPRAYPQQEGASGEIAFVFPERFAEQFSEVLREVPPRPGEEAMYEVFHGLVEAIGADAELRRVFDAAAEAAETDLVTPLFEFRHYGFELPGLWTSIDNNARFGTDYLTRAAAAKSNIFVNNPTETRYFYADLDADGVRLHGAHTYSVTFAPGALPPALGFWSLTLYNDEHFFHANELNRFSLGTKTEDLVYDEDGNLTLYAQHTPPGDDRRANWLPAPDGDFTLYLRVYWPDQPVTDGTWTPPPVKNTSS